MSFRNATEYIEASIYPDKGFATERLKRRQETNDLHTETILFCHKNAKEK
jgi:hypothetical protein